MRSDRKSALEQETVGGRSTFRHRPLETKHELRELARKYLVEHRNRAEALTLRFGILHPISSRSDEAPPAELVARKEVGAREATSRAGIAHRRARHRRKGGIVLVELAQDFRLQHEGLVKPLLQRPPAEGEIGAHHALPCVHGGNALEARAERLSVAEDRLGPAPGGEAPGHFEIRRLAQIDVVPQANRIAQTRRASVARRSRRQLLPFLFLPAWQLIDRSELKLLIEAER